MNLLLGASYLLVSCNVLPLDSCHQESKEHVLERGDAKELDDVRASLELGRCLDKKCNKEVNKNIYIYNISLTVYDLGLDSSRLDVEMKIHDMNSAWANNNCVIKLKLF